MWVFFLKSITYIRTLRLKNPSNIECIKFSPTPNKRENKCIRTFYVFGLLSLKLLNIAFKQNC